MFLATPVVTPWASTRGALFWCIHLKRKKEKNEKDIRKICRWDFSYSVVKKWQTCEVSGFLYPYRVALSWNLISCWSKSKSLNLLIGVAEDQDHLEKYFDKRTKWTYGTVSNQKCIFSRKQKWQTCEVSGFLYPYSVALSWNLISCWSKSKSFMVVNLLIGVAEDQDHLENILSKGLSELTYGTVSTKNGKMKLNKKGGLVDYRYRFWSLHSFTTE